MPGRLKIFLGLAALLLAAACSAQQPDTSLAGALANLTSRAGSVFAGEVTGIRQTGEVLEVHFRVDQAFKGALSGDLVLREWAGLGAARQPRYTLGQRAVLFLYPSTPAGLASPVDGMEGILPLTPSSSSNEFAVDLRRLRTRVLREAGAPVADIADSLPLSQIAATIQTSLAAPVARPGAHPVTEPTLLPVRKPSPIVSQLDAAH